jgi:hypothetical protein
MVYVSAGTVGKLEYDPDRVNVAPGASEGIGLIARAGFGKTVNEFDTTVAPVSLSRSDTVCVPAARPGWFSVQVAVWRLMTGDVIGMFVPALSL